MSFQLPKTLQKRAYSSAVLVISAILFFILTVLVFGGETVSWDKSLLFAINDAFKNSLLAQFMVYISEYGRETYWVGLILALWFFGKTNGRRMAFLMSIAFVVLIAAGDLAKLELLRLRPFQVYPSQVQLLVPPEFDSSYPSGHALIVAAGAAMSWFALRRWLAILGTVDAALVSFSRVYVGIHFPTDVIGGVFFGVAVASLVLVFAKDIEVLFSKIEKRWQVRLVLKRAQEREAKTSLEQISQCEVKEMSKEN